MKREDEIKQAAENYASQMCKDCSTKIYCEAYNWRCIEHREQVDVYADAVKWADNNPPQDVVNLNNIWHDATEAPPKDTHILIESLFFKDDLTYYSYEWTSSSPTGWEKYVKEFYVKRWTYLSHLLPKGGEE